MTTHSETKPGRVRWLLIFWIFLISAVAYLDRVNISIAGPSIAKEFNLSNVQLGGVFNQLGNHPFRFLAPQLQMEGGRWAGLGGCLRYFVAAER